MGKFLFIVFLVINLLCFLNVRNDDNLAIEKPEYKSHKDSLNRKAETGIITYAALGGAAGTLFAFKVYNHKHSTTKKHLKRKLYILLILNIVLFSSVYRNFKRRRR